MRFSDSVFGMKPHDFIRALFFIIFSCSVICYWLFLKENFCFSIGVSFIEKWPCEIVFSVVLAIFLQILKEIIVLYVYRYDYRDIKSTHTFSAKKIAGNLFLLFFLVSFSIFVVSLMIENRKPYYTYGLFRYFIESVSIFIIYEAVTSFIKRIPLLLGKGN